MAATALDVESSSITGTTVTANSVNTGDGVSFVNNGKVRLLLVNNSGGTLTFTAVTERVIENDLAVADRSYSIANGESVYLGPYAQENYGTTVTLNAFSTATSVVLYVLAST